MNDRVTPFRAPITAPKTGSVPVGFQQVYRAEQIAKALSLLGSGQEKVFDLVATGRTVLVNGVEHQLPGMSFGAVLADGTKLRLNVEMGTRGIGTAIDPLTRQLTDTGPKLAVSLDEGRSWSAPLLLSKMLPDDPAAIAEYIRSVLRPNAPRGTVALDQLLSNAGAGPVALGDVAIPRNSSQPTWHEVKPGDTLSQIAQRYGLSPYSKVEPTGLTGVELLARLNSLQDPNQLRGGQRLLIPSADVLDYRTGPDSMLDALEQLIRLAGRQSDLVGRDSVQAAWSLLQAKVLSFGKVWPSTYNDLQHEYRGSGYVTRFADEIFPPTAAYPSMSRESQDFVNALAARLLSATPDGTLQLREAELHTLGTILEQVHAKGSGGASTRSYQYVVPATPRPQA